MLKNIEMSLEDLLGSEYIEAVKTCAVKLLGLQQREADALAREKVAFFDEERTALLDSLADQVGCTLFTHLSNPIAGAATEAYRKAAKINAAPVGGVGCYRAGEDGRLYFASKSEHYQASLGHNFGGYRLLNRARELGIVNATHNNTRGYVTRLLERELIRTANGLEKDQSAELEQVLSSDQPKVLNRVLNLETGSLACEAAIKMMLTRFYRGEAESPPPGGRTPVFLVMGDNEGGAQANYHGTTIFAQTMRGMWPDLYAGCEAHGLYKVVPVRINDIGDFEKKIRQYNQGAYKTIGFIHEIILMNYGAIRLQPEYLRAVYNLCEAYDTPTMSDEIQSCMWYSGMFLTRHYGLNPDFLILGKGFPGGEYPASRVVTTAEMDVLRQFDALVTNGQEEYASLAYLITMAFVQANGDEIDRMGAYIEQRFQSLAAQFPQEIEKAEGKGYLVAVHFKDTDSTVRLCKKLNGQCIDISAQTYKANCPPAALLKLPLVTRKKAVDMLMERLAEAVGEL